MCAVYITRRHLQVCWNDFSVLWLVYIRWNVLTTMAAVACLLHIKMCGEHEQQRRLVVKCIQFKTPRKINLVIHIYVSCRHLCAYVKKINTQEKTRTVLLSNVFIYILKNMGQATRQTIFVEINFVKKM